MLEQRTHGTSSEQVDGGEGSGQRDESVVDDDENRREIRVGAQDPDNEAEPQEHGDRSDDRPDRRSWVATPARTFDQPAAAEMTAQ
jgi:hypothetical protein